jgi:hypothetical protein
MVNAPGRTASNDLNGRITALRRGLFAGIALLAVMAGPAAQPNGVPVARPSSSAPALQDAGTAGRQVVFPTASATATPAGRVADFGAVTPGPDTRRLADWVADTGDHHDRPFFIVDKRRARLYVFDHHARLQADSPVLLGAARGDDSVPGIGSRALAQILPEERTTPAGRFVAEAGRNLKGEDIVWVDYDAAVSMHRVRTGNRQERRAERLATPGIDDNRISYGCINVPATFYDRHVDPVFAAGDTALVYVMPETRPVLEAFESHDANPRRASQRTP